jgi:DNA-binding LacI/PurR family transcriptional regulator
MSERSYPESLPERIRYWLEIRARTQHWLAQRLDVDDALVARWVSKTRPKRVGRNRLRSIAEGLEIPVEYLTVGLEVPKFGSQEPALQAETRRGDSSTRRVFLVATAFKEEWQVELQHELLLVLQREQILRDVFVPAEEFDWSEQSKLQAQVVSSSDQYMGGLLIGPVFGVDRSKELVAFTRVLGKPVVFIDQNPSLRPHQIPANVCFVSVHDREGGLLAATAVLELASVHRISRVLVIAADAKGGRTDAFRATMKERARQIEVEVCKDGDFDRQSAAQHARTYLERGLNANRPFDVVFCTGDSMTMGCIDAISEIGEWQGKPKPRVIGYDGIVPTLRMASAGRVERIVVQKKRELAERSVEELLKLHKGKAEQKIVWISPYLYPRRA